MAQAQPQIDANALLDEQANQIGQLMKENLILRHQLKGYTTDDPTQESAPEPEALPAK